VHTHAHSDLAVTAMFVFIGFRPNTGIIDGHVDHDEMGYLVTDMNMETSMKGLFAAGDVRVQLTRQVTTAAGDGTTAAIAAEKYLASLRDGATAGQIVATGGYAV
jgi:thioredoxin reductase (NADPH)